MRVGIQNKPLQTVGWETGKVRLIDQTALPEKLQYLDFSDWREVAEAIRTMIVRGAPAIGCAAALGIALGSRGIIASGREAFLGRVTGIADTFRAARPTAVNLFWAIDRMIAVAENTPGNPVDMKDALLTEALKMLARNFCPMRSTFSRTATQGHWRRSATERLLAWCVLRWKWAKMFMSMPMKRALVCRA